MMFLAQASLLKINSLSHFSNWLQTFKGWTYWNAPSPLALSLALFCWTGGNINTVFCPFYHVKLHFWKIVLVSVGFEPAGGAHLWFQSLTCYPLRYRGRQSWGCKFIYVVACQRGGVSEEPPWLRAATRHEPVTLQCILFYQGRVSLARQNIIKSNLLNVQLSKGAGHVYSNESLYSVVKGANLTNKLGSQNEDPHAGPNTMH